MNSQPGEFLAITPDASEGLYLFYKNRYFYNLKPLEFDIFNSGNLATGTQVWFFATGSDGPVSSVLTDNLIPPGFQIVKRFDDVPLDPTYKYYKEKFLHRASYNYKYSVFLLKKI
jgi:hypothetical protein